MLNWIIRGAQLSRNAALKKLHQDLVEKGGGSRHSANGATLATVLSRLEDDRVPYTLSAVPGQGYYVEVKPPGERPC